MIQGMKSALLGLASLALVSVGSIASTANADQLLAAFNFRLDANRDYQTSMTPVLGGPQYVQSIRTVVYGNYCLINATDLQFTQTATGPIYRSLPQLGGVFAVNSQVAAINFFFSQSRYRDVDCRIEFWSSNMGPGPGPGPGPTPPPTGNLESRANRLVIDTNFLSISIKMANGYQGLVPQMSGLVDYARYFLDSVKANQSRTRLLEIYSTLKTQTKNFEAGFIQTHSQHRNQDVGDNWQRYLKSLDDVRL